MRAPMAIITTGVVIVVALAVGTSLVGAIATSSLASDAGEQIDYDGARLDGVGSYVAFGTEAGRTETVFETTGFAANFTGASDSELTGDAGHDFGNDTDWHVSVWGEPDAGTSADTLSLASLSDGELRVYYNGSAGEWAAWYYRQSTTDSYEVAVATATPRNGLTNIQVQTNGSYLRIYRNGTLGGVADITQSGTVAAPTEATNWDGRVEELRTFNKSLGSADRTALINNPTEETPALSRNTRIMFDQPQTSDVLFLVSGGRGQLSNADYSAGFAQETVPESGYDWRNDGPQIEPASGADLDGAPVAYATYTEPGSGFALAGLLSWVPIAALIPLVMMAIFIATRVQALRA